MNYYESKAKWSSRAELPSCEYSQDTLPDNMEVENTLCLEVWKTHGLPNSGPFAIHTLPCEFQEGYVTTTGL